MSREKHVPEAENPKLSETAEAMEVTEIAEAAEAGVTAGETDEIADAILRTEASERETASGGKKRAWHERLPVFWKPVIILTGLCLLIGFLLALTNLATKDIIAEQAAERKTAASLQVLPAADSFTQVELDDDTLTEYQCIDAYRADNGAGYVITTHAKGFKGQVEIIVGFGADGKVTGVAALDNDETAGVGTRALEDDYLARYAGLSVNVTHGVDAVSGATITSKAVRTAVGYAAQVYTLLNGEAN